jgi:hypothetical protein
VDNKEIEQPVKGRGGRPKGSKNLHSRDAAKRLVELGFDPIEELVKQHASVTARIKLEEAKEKPSVIALAQLYAVQERCSNNLMRYGYARQTETSEIHTKDLPPMQVVLTPNGYKPGDKVPVLTGSAQTEEMEDTMDNYIPSEDEDDDE